MDSSEISPLIRSDRWASSVPYTPPKEPSMRVFGIVMLAGFGLIGGLSLWTGSRSGAQLRVTLGITLLVLGFVLFMWSLVLPKSLVPVSRAWMRFGETLGTVVSTILLSAVYFVVVTPIGWLMRATGTDPVDRRLERGGGSYWKPYVKSGSPKDYEHMS